MSAVVRKTSPNRILAFTGIILRTELCLANESVAVPIQSLLMDPELVDCTLGFSESRRRPGSFSCRTPVC